jgi:hypothetical protein
MMVVAFSPIFSEFFQASDDLRVMMMMTATLVAEAIADWIFGYYCFVMEDLQSVPWWW